MLIGLWAATYPIIHEMSNEELDRFRGPDTGNWVDILGKCTNFAYVANFFNQEIPHE